MSLRQLELVPAALKRKRSSRPRGQRIPEVEAQVQAAIIQRLTMAGYTVISTSRVRKAQRCSICGRYAFASGGDGVTPGCPDLLVSHPAWPAPLWLGIEVKGTTTKVSAEQKRLAEDGRILIARSQDGIESYVAAYELTVFNRVYGRRLEAT